MNVTWNMNVTCMEHTRTHSPELTGHSLPHACYQVCYFMASPLPLPFCPVTGGYVHPTLLPWIPQTPHKEHSTQNNKWPIESVCSQPQDQRILYVGGGGGGERRGRGGGGGSDMKRAY